MSGVPVAAEGELMVVHIRTFRRREEVTEMLNRGGKS